MTEFHSYFSSNSEMLRERFGTDSRIREALGRYAGRSFVLDVHGDATYVFRIRSDGVTYEMNAPYGHNDMYAGMDSRRARKLVYQHTLSVFDVLFHVTHRNITLEDVEFAKKLFGAD